MLQLLMPMATMMTIQTAMMTVVYAMVFNHKRLSNALRTYICQRIANKVQLLDSRACFAQLHVGELHLHCEINLNNHNALSRGKRDC